MGFEQFCLWMLCVGASRREPVNLTVNETLHTFILNGHAVFVLSKSEQYMVFTDLTSKFKWVAPNHEQLTKAVLEACNHTTDVRVVRIEEVSQSTN